MEVSNPYPPKQVTISKKKRKLIPCKEKKDIKSQKGRYPGENYRIKISNQKRIL